MAEETAKMAEVTRDFLILIGKAGVILDPWDQTILTRYCELAAGNDNLISYIEAIATKLKAIPTTKLGKCAELTSTCARNL